MGKLSPSGVFGGLNSGRIRALELLRIPQREGVSLRVTHSDSEFLKELSSKKSSDSLILRAKAHPKTTTKSKPFYLRIIKQRLF